eukprot:TRINITY_DN20412_c0_g1_i1.p1 TRINITY_DN20412_c0_g1~~TRINITY_DN20412_c0_g1_i1.p1  ORF type:complete len:144 (+),score=23.21 TRINITY_DN20412_c0_g1_i1:55-486(+)
MHSELFKTAQRTALIPALPKDVVRTTNRPKVSIKPPRIEMSELLLNFPTYTRGDPSKKLYIKNLAKTVTESDLQSIFPDCADIKLMNPNSRLRGQAFLTFPTEQLATTALDTTIGSILKNKPIVISFGRTTTKKPTATENRNG